jgi:hypothetical protein
MVWKIRTWNQFWRHFKRNPLWTIKWWWESFYEINFGDQPTDEEQEDVL